MFGGVLLMDFSVSSISTNILISSEARNKVLAEGKVLISSEARNKVLPKARFLF